MKITDLSLIRYDAEPDMLFDWKEPRYIEEVDEEGNVINKIREHLYVKTLFIGSNDSIDNYIEVPEIEEV